MLGSLATFGYAQKRTPWELQQAMRVNPQALIVDTRLHPSCNWSPLWQRRALEITWQERYRWRGDWLGNIHHHTDRPIQLANETHGLPWIIDQLEHGFTVVLLCGCAHYETCHRKVIYDKVACALGARLPSYTLNQRVMTPCGAGHIDPDVPLDVHRARNRYAVVLDVWHSQRYFFPHELTPYDVYQQSRDCVEQGRKHA